MNFEPVRPDRRQNHVLRAVVDEAYERLEPFMDPALSWGQAPFSLWVHHCLLQSFPQLTAHEAQTLARAIHRTYLSRRRSGSPPPPPPPPHSQAPGTQPARV